MNLNIPGIDVELIETVVAALLTFFVFGYLLGDLPALGPLFKFFYRLALHVLVGAGATYALLMAVWSILYPMVWARLWGALQLAQRDMVGIGTAAFGLLLGVLLLFKGSRSLAQVGNISTSYLVGVGLGVATGGAVIGTLFGLGQATATFSGALSVLDLPFLLVGTLTVLISFTFTATGRKGLSGAWAQIVRALSGVGRLFLYAALGAAFAGVYVASVSVLIGRVQSVLPLVFAVLRRGWISF